MWERGHGRVSISFFISRLSRKTYLRAAREIMRGDRYLRRAGNEELLGRLKDTLTTSPLHATAGATSERYFGAALPYADAAVRQYVLYEYGYLKLNEAVLRAVGSGRSAVVALPPEWLSVVEAHGIEVSRRRSVIKWYAVTLLQIVVAIFVAAKHLKISLRGQFGDISQTLPRAHFVALDSKALPQPGSDGRSYDVLTWYANWLGRADVQLITHDVKGAALRFASRMPCSYSDTIPPLRSWVAPCRFVAWFVYAFVLAALDIVRGRWITAMMLKEATKAAAVRYAGQSAYAKDYLFHNSSWVYRPIWTYEVAKAGSRVLFYFYSTNAEGFKTALGYPQPAFGWNVTTWSHFLVWNHYQANFVRRVCASPAQVDIVGPIWFQTSADSLPPRVDTFLAVFDVAPLRDSWYKRHGVNFEYYAPETAVAFLADIQDLTEAYGMKMLWKRKRNIGKIAHPYYRLQSSRLAAAENVIIVSADIAAVRLIEKAEMVISMPFTSTAHIASYLSKPSCYYDPTGRLQAEDRAAGGIELIIGKAALASWLIKHGQPLVRQSSLEQKDQRFIRF